MSKVRLTYLGGALLGFVQEDLGHPLDGDGEGNDGVVGVNAGPAGVGDGPALGPLPRVDVAVGGAEAAEHAVAGLTEQQLLVRVRATLGDDLPSLPGHEVPELVDQEGGGQGLDPAGWDGDQLPADRAPDRGTSVTRPL